MSFAVLMYHSLSDGKYPDSQYPKYTTTKSLFREHMRFLVSEGFETGTFADLLGRAEARQDFPRQYCVITIDDGHKSALDMAEIMSDTNTRGTFFLTADYCRKRGDFLKEDDIRHLSSSGFDFGTHGVTHRALSHMPEKDMALEMKDSKLWLENVIGKAVRCMSLPAGQADSLVYKCAYDAGYRLVGNSMERLNDMPLPPAPINRFVVLAGYGCGEIRAIVRGSPVYVLKRRLRSMILSVPKRMLHSYDEVRK
jgi:peptidoglycan/xylan/chitin deacetylase (PgdA/CDA1 family)